MEELDPEYGAEVDNVSEKEWYDVIGRFNDSNLYQTWSYDGVRLGAGSLSHFLLRKRGKVVAAAQARMVRLPLIGKVMAYVRWAPMWKVRDEELNAEAFRQALRGLRNEYVVKRGLILRVRPVLFMDRSDGFLSVMREEGYTKIRDARGDRTLLMDLRIPLEELRRGIKERWRNYLNRAEKESLEVIEGHSDDLFADFIEIYREMIGRKGFLEPNDINEFRLIQKELPEEFKMKVMLARSNGVISNGIICSLIGSTGIYLFGATSDSGLRTRGAYLLQWRMIEWLKEKGCSCYDLNGINPESNPGTYQFKTGLSGKNGKDVYFLGQFDAYPNWIGRFVVMGADKLRRNFGLLKRSANNVPQRVRSGRK